MKPRRKQKKGACAGLESSSLFGNLGLRGFPASPFLQCLLRRELNPWSRGAANGTGHRTPARRKVGMILSAGVTDDFLQLVTFTFRATGRKNVLAGVEFILARRAKIRVVVGLDGLDGVAAAHEESENENTNQELDRTERKAFQGFPLPSSCESSRRIRYFFPIS